MSGDDEDTPSSSGITLRRQLIYPEATSKQLTDKQSKLKKTVKRKHFPKLKLKKPSPPLEGQQSILIFLRKKLECESAPQSPVRQSSRTKQNLASKLYDTTDLDNSVCHVALETDNALETQEKVRESTLSEAPSEGSKVSEPTKYKKHRHQSSVKQSEDCSAEVNEIQSSHNTSDSSNTSFKENMSPAMKRGHSRVAQSLVLVPDMDDKDQDPASPQKWTVQQALQEQQGNEPTSMDSLGHEWTFQLPTGDKDLNITDDVVSVLSSEVDAEVVSVESFDVGEDVREQSYEEFLEELNVDKQDSASDGMLVVPSGGHCGTAECARHDSIESGSEDSDIVFLKHEAGSPKPCICTCRHKRKVDGMMLDLTNDVIVENIDLTESCDADAAASECGDAAGNSQNELYPVDLTAVCSRSNSDGSLSGSEKSMAEDERNVTQSSDSSMDNPLQMPKISDVRSLSEQPEGNVSLAEFIHGMSSEQDPEETEINFNPRLKFAPPLCVTPLRVRQIQVEEGFDVPRLSPSPPRRGRPRKHSLSDKDTIITDDSRTEDDTEVTNSR